MSISKASLSKITDAASPVESVKATLDALCEDQTFPVDAHKFVATAKLALDHHASQLNAAIMANASN